MSKDKVAELVIQNWKGGLFEVTSVPAHQKNPELGERPLFRSQHVLMDHQDAASVKAGDKVTLMKWGNVRILAVE